MESIAAALEVELVDASSDSQGPSFSEDYSSRVGKAFARERIMSTHKRQFLLFWLGICVREGSLEQFERSPVERRTESWAKLVAENQPNCGVWVI